MRGVRDARGACPVSGPSRAFIEQSPQVSASTPAQTSVTDTAGVILYANGRRKGLVVQNTGTTIIKLAFGSTSPTQGAYHVALSACTVANDGSGGIYVDDAWAGEVRAISSTAGGTIVTTEFRLGAPDWNEAGDWGIS